VTDCQTHDGADVRIWTWIPGSPCQDWVVTKVAEPNVFRIADGNTGKVLDVAGCSTADTAIIHLWPYSGANCQQWRIDPIGAGAYKVIGVGSGKSLDVAGCSPDAGANVIIWPFHGGPCQRWFFEPL
jgi:Ricin-type beta-trefoil lectin domain-like